MYPCCPNGYVDITYYLVLRRKAGFYIVNLVAPCVAISFLTLITFYLPSDSHEKIVLCISILICLTIFFLLLVEIIPSTSITIPLVGKFLLFTMVLVTLSIIVTVITINVHFRNPACHTMPDWVRKIFLELLPPYLSLGEGKARMTVTQNIRRKRYKKARPSLNALTVSSVVANVTGVTAAVRSPGYEMLPIKETRTKSTAEIFDKSITEWQITKRSLRRGTPARGTVGPTGPKPWSTTQERIPKRRRSADVGYPTDSDATEAVNELLNIGSYLRDTDITREATESWRFVALVMDRIFLACFSIVSFVGTLVILLQAPYFRDFEQPIPMDENRPFYSVDIM